MKGDQSNRNRRLKRVFIAGLALYALYLCIGIWGVPALVESLLESKGSEISGRKVTVEDARFNPFTWQLSLYGLEVSGASTEEFLVVDKLVANAQVASLLPNRVSLKRFIVEGARGTVVIDESGRFNFQDILDRIAAMPEDEEEEEVAKPLRARVGEIVVSECQLRFVDRSLASAFEETFVIERLYGRGVGTQPRDQEASASEGAADEEPFLHWTFEMEGRTESGASVVARGGATSVEPWGFYARLQVDDAALGKGGPYLNEFAVVQVDGQSHLELIVLVDLENAAEPEIRARGNFAIAELAAKDDSQSYLSASAFTIEEFEAVMPARSLSLRGVRLEAPVFTVALDENGELKLPTLLEPEIDSAAATTGESAEPLPSFSFSVKDSGMFGSVIEIRDNSLAQDFETRIESLDIIVSELQGGAQNGSIDASAEVALAATILDGTVNGSLSFPSLSDAVTVTGEWANVNLAPLQPYVNQFALVSLERGSVSGGFAGELSLDGSVSLTGNGRLEGLSVIDTGEEGKLTEIALIALEDFSFSNEAGFRAEALIVSEPKLRVILDESGINLARLTRAEEPVTEEQDTPAVAEPQATPAEQLPFPIEIGRVEVRNGGIEFSDRSLVSTFNSQLSDLEFTARDIATREDSVAQFEFSSNIDNRSTLSMTGKVSPLDPTRLLEVVMTLEQFDLTATSPYWETYLARELDNGQFRIESKAQLHDSVLSATNDITIDKLTLGNRVQSDQAMLANLPIGLAIGLLKDPNGMITFDGFPVSGDLSQPDIDVWGLVGKAFQGLIVNAASAPFKFLGNLVGGREDLDTIEFPAGDVALNGEGLEKTGDLGRALELRPALMVEVRPWVDKPSETAQLKRRLVAFRLMNPDREPQSIEELTDSYEQPALAEAARQAYLELMDSETPDELGDQAQADQDRDQQGNDRESEVASSDDGPQTEERGFFKRIGRFFGLGRDREDREEAPDPPETITQADSEGDAVDGESEESLPSFDEMMAALVAEVPDDAVSDDWLRQLGVARAVAVKEAILSSATLEPQRISIGSEATAPQGADGSGVRLELDAG